MQAANNTNSELQLIGAIDQGTSSTRFLVFESGSGQLMASSQIPIQRIVPKEGWVEIDPMEIIKSVQDTIQNVYEQLSRTSATYKSSRSSSPSSQEFYSTDSDGSIFKNIKCIGICNQRESTIVWDKITGKPLNNVIVWMDNRTKDLVDQLVDSVPGRDINWLKTKTGLPMSTYFSAFKLKWLIDNVDEVKQALKDDTLLFGTVDSWILWNLTGGSHMTDVTNASRTFLMDVESLEWDKTLCDYFKIPLKILPKIMSSADDFGLIKSGPLKGLPITGVIGDQSAALFGHHCLQIGQTKATFGTGCFIMQNIGPGPLNGAMSGVHRDAKRGLITTVAYKLRNRPASYALEGSIKIAGAGFAWLRDNLQLISNFEESDELVNRTTNSAGVFFVPALGGLYSPYWDPNAAGIFIGLSQFSRREHLIRATFDSIAFQTNDILSLMRGVNSGLMIDGGLCKSNNLCQILADLTGCDIVRPSMCETSALGAAMVAGCGANIYNYESLLEKAKLPFDSYGFASSPECVSIHHHHPQQSLNYEEKFSALIESKSRQMSELSNRSNSIKNDFDRDETITSEEDSTVLFVSNAKSERVNEAIGVNDDAGGGGGNGGMWHNQHQLQQQDDSNSQSSPTAMQEDMNDHDEIESTVSTIDEIRELMQAGPGDVGTDDTNACCIIQRLSSVGPESSGYSSGDACERNSDITNSIHVSTTSNHNHLHHNDKHNRNHHNNHIDHANSRNPSPYPNGQSPRSTNCVSRCSSSTPKTMLTSEATDGGDDADVDSLELANASSSDSLNGPHSKTIVNLAPVDVFQSYISVEHRIDLVHTWHRAVERSMQWTKIDHEEVRRIDYQRLSSLPISMYLFLSIGMVALSGFLHLNSASVSISS